MFAPGVLIQLKRELDLQTNIGFRVREFVKDTDGKLIHKYMSISQPDMWVVDFSTPDREMLWYPVCERDMVIVSIFKDTDYESV